MFKQARIKLTAVYLVIIMSVSMAFSGVIYRASNFELKRFADAQRNRIERRIPIDQPIFSPDDELLEEARLRIIRSLVVINLGVLTFSAVIGYYLSGITLAPISEMMDEQYRFVSDASHELKTPLTAMKSTLEVSLRDKKLDLTEAKRTIATSLEEVDQLQKLAEGLLQLSQHKNAVVLSPTSLKQIVDKAEKMVEPLAANKNIKLMNKVGKITIKAEADSLMRAIIAILDNAIKYSPQKTEITLSTKTNSRSVELYIKDQGKGIEADEVEHLFDRFYRGEKSRSSEGHGLGLSIAKQIVESHGGEIKVKSKKNQGAIIIITLPFSGKIQS